MKFILLSITSIELLVSILALLGGILLIKRQDNKRHNYFLYKKRIRILREFKDIFYSYTLYRSSISQEIDVLLNDEKICQLTRNNFFKEKGNLFENLDCQNRYIFLQGKLNRLELLSDDFMILYDSKQSETIQTFIFWYKALLQDIASYKKGMLEEKVDYKKYTVSVKVKLKHLEEVYEILNESFLILELERQTKIVI